MQGEQRPPSEPESPTQLAPSPYPFIERFGPYFLIERIGRGGMAEVFKAATKGAHGFYRTLAVKRLRPEHVRSLEHLRMFADEARISAMLHHPNIVQVHDFGKIDGVYFIAMEYLRGWNLGRVLHALVSSGRTLPPALAAHVALEIATGLAYAHGLRASAGESLDLVHRDVSPGNIMLLRSGGVKLLDFGVAKAMSQTRLLETRGGVLKGTLSYLTPEQIEGGKLDARTDVFALGIVLWEMLAGRRLFGAKTEFQVMQAVLSRPVPPPSQWNRGVPLELDAIALRALERDPARRYQRASDMADDLDGVVRASGVRKRELPDLLEDLFGLPLTNAGQALPPDADESLLDEAASDVIAAPGPTARAASEPDRDPPTRESPPEPDPTEPATVHDLPTVERTVDEAIAAGVPAVAFQSTVQRLPLPDEVLHPELAPDEPATPEPRRTAEAELRPELARTERIRVRLRHVSFGTRVAWALGVVLLVGVAAVGLRDRRAERSQAVERARPAAAPVSNTTVVVEPMITLPAPPVVAEATPEPATTPPEAAEPPPAEEAEPPGEPAPEERLELASAGPMVMPLVVLEPGKRRRAPAKVKPIAARASRSKHPVLDAEPVDVFGEDAGFAR